MLDLDTVELSNEEILRYSRHLLIPDVGLEGQRKLKAASATLDWWISMWLTNPICSAR